MEIQENIAAEDLTARKRFENPFRVKTMFKFAEKFPRFYFTLCFALALVGIAFFVIFPLLFITLPFDIYKSVLQASSLNEWIEVAIYSVVFILSGLLSWALYKVKFAEPSGIEVTEKSFPLLQKLISDMQEEYECNNLHRIILRDKYEIRVIKTPRSGIPFRTENTLVIGLPVLLSHSPLYFRVLLARKIGQLSAKHTLISTWLYFLIEYWEQYRIAAMNSSSLFAKFYGLLLKVYSPLYKKFLNPLMHDEELEADSYSMDIVNNQDMVEAMVYEEVVSRFLENKFWPKINQIAKRTKTPEFTPYAQMSKVIRNGVTSEELSSTIQELMNEEMDSYSTMPSLRKRLNHMGHTRPSAPKKMQKSAGESLLGQNLEKVIQLFDKRWLKLITHRNRA